MKRLIYILTLTAFTFSGCVSKSDYEKLKQENETLTIEINQLNIKINTLTIEKEEMEEKKRIAALHTEADALKLIKDYYEFYDADNIYRKPKVRRVSENVFRISLEECPRRGEFSNDNFFWRSTVIKLTIYEDGKYDVIREMH
jgi:hypothetical protein